MSKTLICKVSCAFYHATLAAAYLVSSYQDEGVVEEECSLESSLRPVQFEHVPVPHFIELLINSVYLQLISSGLEIPIPPVH
jgi:hypothetical protein